MQVLEPIKYQLQLIKGELLEKYHVSSIGLFGSVVRNDFNENSDIDIVVDFNREVGIEFIDLACYLESLLHRKIDLVSRKGIKPKYYKEIEDEIVYV